MGQGALTKREVKVADEDLQIEELSLGSFGAGEKLALRAILRSPVAPQLLACRAEPTLQILDPSVHEILVVGVARTVWYVARALAEGIDSRLGVRAAVSHPCAADVLPLAVMETPFVGFVGAVVVFPELLERPGCVSVHRVRLLVTVNSVRYKANRKILKSNTIRLEIG